MAVHGAVTRIRFEEATPVGACAFETQRRSTPSSMWSGTYRETECHAGCDGVHRHGETIVRVQARVRYDASDGECRSEVQTRSAVGTCADGVLRWDPYGPFSGTFRGTHCPSE